MVLYKVSYMDCLWFFVLYVHTLLLSTSSVFRICRFFLPLPTTFMDCLFLLFALFTIFCFGFSVGMFLIFCNFILLHFRILYGVVSVNIAQRRWSRGHGFLALILVWKDWLNTFINENDDLSFSFVMRFRLCLVEGQKWKERKWWRVNWRENGKVNVW